jgi:5-hydroxyisourate hydrolase-like protein (transthyretin family)
MFGDFDFLFGEDEPDPDGRVYVSFQDEHASEEQTETDVKNMEGRLKMSLQELKEQVLGKVKEHFLYGEHFSLNLLKRDNSNYFCCFFFTA